MLYSYNVDIYVFIEIIILIVVGFIIDFIIELYSFKKFAKEKYNLNINLLIFTKELIKAKKHKIL